MSTGEKRIRHIVGSPGDWFQIQIERLTDQNDRIVMSRVCAWAVVTYEHSTDSVSDLVEGIDSNGYGHGDDYLDYFYVYGTDLAPNGKSWLAVFNETPSFNWGLKDISHIPIPTDRKPAQAPESE